MKNLLLSVFLVALFFGISRAQPDFSNQFDYKYNLSSALGQNPTPITDWYYMLYYSVRGPNITFGVVCGVRNATDWCGIGFSDYGGMTGSDAVVGSYNSSTAQAQVFDLFLDNQNEPTSLGNTASACVGAVCSDAIYTGTTCTNNVYNVGGSYTPATGQTPPGYLYFTFTRPLAATDAICDQAIHTEGPTTPNTTYIIFSIGSVYSTGAFPFSMQQHYYTLQSALEPYEVVFKQAPSPSPSPSINSSPSPSTTPSTTPTTTPTPSMTKTPTPSLTPTPTNSPSPVPSASRSPDDATKLAPMLTALLELIF